MILCIPFICVGVGAVAGFFIKKKRILRWVEKTIDIGLMVLMTVIGLSIGANELVMKNLGNIGLQSMVLSISAIAFSVFFVRLLEKTWMPLGEIRKRIEEEARAQKWDVGSESSGMAGNEKVILYLIGACVLLGILFGVLFRPFILKTVLDYVLMGSLILLYTGVGFSLGGNKRVFLYMKTLGFRVGFLALGVFAGSALSGLLWGFLLPIPVSTSLIASSGMSYYSITGAYMTQVFGIEAGTYGFMVNVMREFFTVLFLPILIRISPGSAIASGAAGNMDTMLMPITKFVGKDLSLVTLITGVLLTLLVPFLLPVLAHFFI